MAQAAKKRLVVAGGTGFLGSRICKSAVARGWDVVSIRYHPPSSALNRYTSATKVLTTPSQADPATPPGPPLHPPRPPHHGQPLSTGSPPDILKPSTYTAHLASADAVIHSMGILLEADYKGVLTGREFIVSGLSRAFSSTKQGSAANPLNRSPTSSPETSSNPTTDDLSPGEKDGPLTYELMNRDSAIALAQESQLAGAKTFVYISAAAGAPLLPGRYISTKREAESTISSEMVHLRNIFIRPGFLYDSSRKFTLPIAASGMVGSSVNSLVGGVLTGVFGAAVEKPLKADLVAEAVVEAIGDGETRGVVGTREIEALASKAWRRTML